MTLVAEQNQGAMSLVQILLGLAETAVLVLLYFLCLKSGLAFLISRVPSAWMQVSWHYGLLSHAALLLTALAFIAILRPFFRGSFGLRLPRRGATHVCQALWIGALFGIAMLCIDYYPSLLHISPPPGPYATNPGNVVPWLLIQGLVVGITEETVFRGLFLGYLLSRVPYQVRLKSFQVSAAGILIAAVFALAHAQAFEQTSFLSALGQQIYAIGIGLFCAYLFEQSGSILAPAVAHSAGDFVEWSCCFVLSALGHK